MSKVPPIHVFIDFDGTISPVDMGDEIFRRFGTFEPHHSRLVAGEMSIYAYWRTLFDSLPVGFSQADIAAFLDEHAPDPGFDALRSLCLRKKIPLTVLSDGFDLYIRPFLEQHNASDIPVICNKAELRPQNKPVITFTGASESCRCFSASCKRNFMLNSAPPEALLVYIGDGRSDFCAVRYADIIFAKKSLAAYCNENKLPHYPYSTLADVVRILSGLLLRPRALRRRRQAELARDAAFAAE